MSKRPDQANPQSFRYEIRNADVPQGGHTERILRRLTQPLTDVERFKLLERTTVEAAAISKRL